jgi:CubicO group peptidase (beta-lactamase class C family)
MAAETKPATDYAQAIDRLGKAVGEQMETHGIRGISVALVDDQRMVYAAGFGTARRDTVFRCGSISKLFNAVAIMQLVEQGKLDLDAPISRYGPEFSLVVPFEGAPPVTLRQVLCHRSGLTRESPVGGYLDDSQPTLAQTVDAVRSCPLVSPPNSETRYSNIGPSIAGQILVKVTGIPYEQYQKEKVLGPLGMTSSSFVRTDVPRERLVPARMRVADGHGGFTMEPAPLFDLGTLPAGNLFSTAEDLAKFISMLAAEGRAGGRTIISPKTLAEMCTTQFSGTDARFGLGFVVGKFREHKSLGHMGEVYGYTASLAFLAGPKLGAVILGNEDIASAPISKLTNTALSLLVEAKLGEKPPVKPEPVAIAREELAAMTGEYESTSHWAKIELRGDRLVGNISCQPITLTAAGPLKFLADGRIWDATPLEFQRDAGGKPSAFTMIGQKFTRVDPKDTPAVPPLWSQFAGSYGPAFIPLVVHVHHGHLYATIENELDYRLVPASRNVFVCPPGMYYKEHLVFLTTPESKVHGASIAGMYLRRR